MNTKKIKRFIKLITSSFLCVLMLLSLVSYKTNITYAEEVTETDVVDNSNETNKEGTTLEQGSTTDTVVQEDTNNSSENNDEATTENDNKQEETPVEEEIETNSDVKLTNSAPLLTNTNEPNTTWQNDWYYILNEEEGKILLKQYRGYDTELVVPAKAIIDGKEYVTYLTTNNLYNPNNRYSPFDYYDIFIQFESISFEKGVKTEADASFLFYDANIKELDVSNLDTSETTNMSLMFAYIQNLKTLDVSNLDTTNVDFTKGGSQVNMFRDLGGYYGFEATVIAGPDSAFANNIRKDSEYKYPGYSHDGNYGITGPEGIERVFCLNNHLDTPSSRNDYSNYYKLIDQEEYLGAAYKKDADIIPEGKQYPVTKSLTEDDMAKIAAAILYADNAASRIAVQNAIYKVTEGEGEYTGNNYYNEYVEPNWQALKGKYDMHIYVSEDPNAQNLVSVKRVISSGTVLEITKETLNEPEDVKGSFDLTLTFKDEEGEPFAGKTIAVEKVTDVVEDHVFELDENGQTKFKIKSGQTVKIFNLPAGVTYKIEEADTEGYKLIKSEKLEGTIEEGENKAKLVNDYIHGIVQVDGLKVLEGREFKSGDSFTFTISGSDGAPLPKETSVTINPESGSEYKFTFGEIKFTASDIGKTYTYTVTENADVNDVENDSAKHTITVTVKEPEKGSGTLNIACKYSDGEQLVFTNKYKEEKKKYTIPKTGVE